MKAFETHLSTEAISAYVDGELAAGARARAARHIATCFECAYAVGVQQQAKDTLSCGCDGVDVPATLLSRLGQIPFSADLGARSLDDVGLYADGAGRFEFRVAAPADPQRSSRTGLGNRRGRTFRSSAATVALVGIVAGPVLPQAGGQPARGHQIQVANVLTRHLDHDATPTER
ncbi:zf-HC2 domain-containing protein [Blastococcus sp. Marseille-P5729]|uniref:zf-HC2 domain-containing protein n=1 Tax=Blastococcus sp. Marseille-P5729 TaxID=2086582 RepID=UPI000D0E8FB3|nr:zf-HC2 domain-containing protein [Blastococcus sp. Marseille-P5729]